MSSASSVISCNSFSAFPFGTMRSHGSASSMDSTSSRHHDISHPFPSLESTSIEDPKEKVKRWNEMNKFTEDRKVFHELFNESTDYLKDLDEKLNEVFDDSKEKVERRFERKKFIQQTLKERMERLIERKKLGTLMLFAERDETERRLDFVTEKEVGVTGGYVYLGSSTVHIPPDCLTKSTIITLRIPLNFRHLLSLLPQELSPITVPLEVSAWDADFTMPFSIFQATWARSVKHALARLYKLNSDNVWDFFDETILGSFGVVEISANDRGLYVAALSDSDIALSTVSVESALFKHASGNLATTHHISCDEIRGLSIEERKDQGYVQIGDAMATQVKPDDFISVQVESSEKDLYTFVTEDTTLKIDRSLYKDFQSAGMEFSLRKKGECSNFFTFHFKVGDEKQEITMEAEATGDEIGADVTDVFDLVMSDSSSHGNDFDPVEDKEIPVVCPGTLHTSMTVSCEGGEITCGDCSIFFPSGAIARPTDVALSLLDGSHHWPDGYAGAFSLIRCEPSEMHLAIPATVKVRTWYTRAHGSNEEMHVFTRDDEEANWHEIHTLDPDQREVEFECCHFSDFLITFRKSLNYFGIWLHHLRPFVFHNNNGNIHFGLRTDDEGKLKMLKTEFEKDGYRSTFVRLSAIKTSMGQSVSMEISCNRGNIALHPQAVIHIDVKHGDMEEMTHCCMATVKYEELLMIGYTIKIPEQKWKEGASNITLKKGKDRRQTSVETVAITRTHRTNSASDNEVASLEGGVSDMTLEQSARSAIQPPLSVDVQLGGNRYQVDAIGNFAADRANQTSTQGGKTTVAGSSSIGGSHAWDARRRSEHLQLPSSSSPGTSSQENPQPYCRPLGNQIPGNVYGTYVGANAQATLYKHGGQEIVASGCDVARGQKLDARYCQGEKNSASAEKDD